MHGSVGSSARLGRDVSTVRGRDARIGCTRAKLCGHAKEHWGKGIKKGYICSLSSCLVFFTQFYSFLLED